MMNSVDIQHAYDDLYEELRKYIWSFNVLELIVDLELAVYKAIPSLKDIDTAFRKLMVETKSIAAEDEDLSHALDAFSSIVDESENTYMKLTQVKEVLQ